MRFCSSGNRAHFTKDIQFPKPPLPSTKWLNLPFSNTWKQKKKWIGEFRRRDSRCTNQNPGALPPTSECCHRRFWSHWCWPVSPGKVRSAFLSGRCDRPRTLRDGTGFPSTPDGWWDLEVPRVTPQTGPRWDVIKLSGAYLQGAPGPVCPAGEGASLTLEETVLNAPRFNVRNETAAVEVLPGFSGSATPDMAWPTLLSWLLE